MNDDPEQELPEYAKNLKKFIQKKSTEFSALSLSFNK